MLYLFRPFLFLTAYATLLGLPLFVLLALLSGSMALSVGVTIALIGAAVIDKSKRHLLLSRGTWSGRSLLRGEILLLGVSMFVALFFSFLPDSFGILLFSAALGFPVVVPYLVVFLVAWVWGVVLVPRELQEPRESLHAT